MTKLDCMTQPKETTYGPRAYWGSINLPVSLSGPAMTTAAAIARQDVDACLLFLRHSLSTTPRERQGIVARIMLHSVFVQAGLEGIVECSRCGDRGCGFCRVGVL